MGVEDCKTADWLLSTNVPQNVCWTVFPEAVLVFMVCHWAGIMRETWVVKGALTVKFWDVATESWSGATRKASILFQSAVRPFQKAVSGLVGIGGVTGMVVVVVMGVVVVKYDCNVFIKFE